MIHDRRYRDIRNLCNNAKHFVDLTKIGGMTDSFSGSVTGFSQAGDSLGQKNYTLRNEDLRHSINHVMRLYHAFFS